MHQSRSMMIIKMVRTEKAQNSPNIMHQMAVVAKYIHHLPENIQGKFKITRRTVAVITLITSLEVVIIIDQEMEGIIVSVIIIGLERIGDIKR